ncbi:MAG: hypothetical protein LBG69_07710 [Zoogloeaceae bacterium]|jgi:hypothetical protein|nr:hypothetical protein [Zoogloeaceae bacterium]
MLRKFVYVVMAVGVAAHARESESPQTLPTETGQTQTKALVRDGSVFQKAQTMRQREQTRYQRQEHWPPDSILERFGLSSLKQPDATQAQFEEALLNNPFSLEGDWCLNILITGGNAKAIYRNVKQQVKTISESFQGHVNDFGRYEGRPDFSVDYQKPNTTDNKLVRVNIFPRNDGIELEIFTYFPGRR